MTTRVIVIGAGIMGCCTALELAKRGASVVLLERAVPGAEASSAAAGILGAQVEAAAHGRTPHFEGALRAREGYAAFCAELRERTGIDAGYKKCGVLKAAKSEEDAKGFADVVAWQGHAGARVELLSDTLAREVEPALSEDVRSALYFPDDAQVDPRALLRALIVAVTSARTELRAGTTVRSLLVEGGACKGVALEDGELRGDAVVLAAGSWSSLVPGVPSTMPRVEPVRGQVVALEERPPSVKTIVFGARGYVVPRGDGRVLCGSTMEQVGFRREVTAAGVVHVLSTAIGLIPALASAQLGESWSNFRPMSKEPLVGRSPMQGLFLATGHFRSGILLAHETGVEVAAAIMG
jgi:glycine oxidase